jgi:hypothetical protein
MTPETKLKVRILKYLASFGKDIWFFKVAGGPFQMPGVPDIIGCYRGKMFGIEAKSKSGKPTDRQLHEIEKINAAGGVAGLAYSLEDAQAIMEKLA